MPGSVEVVFETHSLTDDNEAGVATGWHPGRLSQAGRDQARLLGERRKDDGIVAIFTSDLARALETVRIAFRDVELPTLHDWRLRECNYGEMNGSALAAEPSNRAMHVDDPYPGGESWSEAIARVASFVPDLRRWTGQRVLVIGHAATRWGLDHYVDGTPIDQLVSAPFDWAPGWEYRVTLPR
jgi:2,3-bisphosphoglycerate-dependent phosphoglycerate mutase